MAALRSAHSRLSTSHPGFRRLGGILPEPVRPKGFALRLDGRQLLRVALRDQARRECRSQSWFA